ncbi:MaoC family dehydratase [Marinobacter orientalis]|uniref:MaoC family dehydratase n=1 Tax=Marinobacter orientalis TaxID=1928859 RepID=A0A7Y0NKR0_9GAMM|nr:MaoC family dehydratase [Marinobacter orientalis]NMT62973.1 MaoC family dehydratase [Marinobacter orientalis]TGX51639.1 MaoC family dehydratase [Marinobacter orientalis]
MLSVELNDLEKHKGSLIGHSPWKTVTQEMIQAFADATGDHQWIHLDVERARRESPWKSTVAHGFLTASLIPLLNQQVINVQGKSASINYGIDKLRFPAAVKSGSAIRSKMELMDVTRVDDRRTLATYRTTVEIQGEDKPACVAENLVMYVA